MTKKNAAAQRMNVITVVALIVSLFPGCHSSKPPGANGSGTARRMSEDEKHRLYSAALASSDSPLDSDLFKQVCHRIEVFAADGKPNDRYQTFIKQHVEWAGSSETEEFRREINSQEKAREYIKRHLPAE